MQEELQEIYEQVRAAFEREDPQAAAGLVVGLAAADVAELFAGLDRDEKIEIVRRLPPEDAAAVLSEVDDRSLPELFELLQDEEIVGLLDELDSDDAADIVGQLEDVDADRLVALLDQVDHQDAVEISELLRYPEDSAGGLMAKEYLSVGRGATVGKVVAALRRLDEGELLTLHSCFVTDRAGRLVGAVPLLRLLLSDPAAKVADIMEADPLSVDVMVDQEEVAHIFRKRDLFSLPVVDESRRLLGRVTVDDVIDVLTEEADEDVARLAGSNPEELGEVSVLRISRARLPWLMLGLFGQLLAALVLGGFEASLQEFVVLTLFIPMVMATAGNTGIQTSTIMIRRLVTSGSTALRPARQVGRELSVSTVNAAVLGLTILLVLWLWKSDPVVGIVIGLALASVVLLASVVGTVVPLFLHRVGADPTVATGPLITTINDVLGLLAYLGLANWLLRVL